MLDFFKKIKFIYFFWFFFYLFILFLLWRGAASYLDPDFGWHLSVGQEIAVSGQVPGANHYNYTYTGNWVDHEWLSNLIIANIYEVFGYQGLIFLFSLLVVLALIWLNLLFRFIAGRNSPEILIAVLQVFGLMAAWPHFGVRVQQVALLFLLGLLIILYFYDQSRRWIWLLPLPLLFYFWANLHASFLMGLAVLLFWLGVKGAVWLFAKTRLSFRLADQIISRRQVLAVSVFFALSLAATLFTPYRLELYAFLSDYGNTVYQSYIMEWLSQFSYPFYYWQLLYLAFVGTAIFLSLYFAFGREKKPLNFWHLALAGLFFLLSFQSRRHFPLLFVASFPLFASLAANFSLSHRRHFSHWPLWLKGYLIICLSVASLLQIYLIDFRPDPRRDFSDDYPVAAADFLCRDNSTAAGNLFSEYVWGGYLIWTCPQRRLFIDGRLPQVPYAGHTFLEEYLEFLKSDADYQAKLDQYDISLVLIKSPQPDLKAKPWEKLLFQVTDADLSQRSHFREYLEMSPAWSRLYSDDTAVIYSRQ